jgi:hypothetical protein
MIVTVVVVCSFYVAVSEDFCQISGIAIRVHTMPAASICGAMPPPEEAKAFDPSPQFRDGRISRCAGPLNELAAIGPFGQLSRRQKNSERRRQDLPSLRRLPSAAFSRQFIERNPQKNSERSGQGAETFTREYLRCDGRAWDLSIIIF